MTYAFLGMDAMIANAYIIFRGVPQSPDAITHQEVRLRRAWKLILAGAGQISAYKPHSLKSQNSSGQMLKRTVLYRAVAVGTFQFILRGESDCGVGFVTGRRGRTQQRTPSFYQRIAGNAPSVSSRCVSTVKGTVLLSFINIKWES